VFTKGGMDEMSVSPPPTIHHLSSLIPCCPTHIK
jgi:hypothetical protein